MRSERFIIETFAEPTRSRGDADRLVISLLFALINAVHFEVARSMRRRRVERIVAPEARSSSSKAAGPVGRIVRDHLLPFVFDTLSRRSPRHGCTSTTSIGRVAYRSMNAMPDEADATLSKSRCSCSVLVLSLRPLRKRSLNICQGMPR
jgi:hypothetical protein